MISLYFGSPGAGKSTLAARLVFKNQKKQIYDKVYTNFECKGAYQIQSSDFATFTPAENSLVIIDESGIEFNNRLYESAKENAIKSLNSDKLNSNNKPKVLQFIPKK